MSRIFWLLCGAVLLAVPASAADSPGSSGEPVERALHDPPIHAPATVPHHGPSHASGYSTGHGGHVGHRYAGTLSALWLTEATHPAAQIGGALALEATLFPFLEAELELGLLSMHGDLTLPIELFAKVPFHLGLWEPFVGLGPTLVTNLGAHPGFHAGVASCAGTRYWLGKHFGLSAQLKYSVLFDKASAIQEAGATFGFVAAL